MLFVGLFNHFQIIRNTVSPLPNIKKRMGKKKPVECKDRRRGICGAEFCVHCRPKSFADHPKAKCWSEKNELLPHQVPKKSMLRIYFDCDDCGHEIHPLACHVGNDKMAWCCFCNGGVLCDDQDCNWCFEHSFASFFLSYFWSLLNFPVTPRDVRLSSRKKYWFDCENIAERKNPAVVRLWSE